MKTEEYLKMEMEYFRKVWKELRAKNFWYGILYNPLNPNQELPFTYGDR